MYETDEPEPRDIQPDDASEIPDPPRPVRGLLWIVIPAVAGAGAGALWSAYNAAAQRLDPATPIWFGGAVGLGIGAFLWVAFPYKRRPRGRPNTSERDLT